MNNLEKCTLPCCEEKVIHQESVKNALRKMPCEEDLFDLADLFKAFSDTTRIKILFALMQEEMCVCDLSELIGVSQSAVSHQLRSLKLSRLVKYRREGKSIFYSLDDDHVRSILAEGMAHIEE